MTTLLAAYAWDARSRQYVGASGRFVPRSEVKAALDAVIEAAARDVDAIAARLQAGEVDVLAWYLETAAKVKVINVAAAALAAGGTHALTPSILGAAGARVKEQYHYLRDFAREVESGLPLDAAFRARALLYAHSGRPTFEAIARKADLAAGLAFERRVLRAAEHCAGCVAQAAMGWQEAGVLLPIGDCECLNYCRCAFERSRSRPAAFSRDEPGPAGGAPMTAKAVEYVEREGKVFEFGDYPDKQFSLTPEEFAAANPDGGAGAPIDLEHFRRPHPLLGKLGKVISTRVQGSALFARVRWPRALDELLAGEERKVSCHFGPDKRLRQLDLVLNPRIKDAALFSAGAADADAPAIGADPGPSTAAPAVVFAAMPAMPAPGLPMALIAQDFHDLAASCYPSLCGGPATFSTAEGPRKHMALVHKKAMNHGATCPAASGRFSEETDMPETDKADHKPGDGDATLSAAAPTEREQALLRRLEEMEARERRSARNAILKDAAVFAESLVREGRAEVTERPAIVKGYVRAAVDDLEHPADATFSVGEGDGAVTFSATRLADFLARESARPKAAPSRTLNKAVAAPAAPAGYAVFSNDADPDALTPQRMAELDRLVAANAR